MRAQDKRHLTMASTIIMILNVILACNVSAAYRDELKGLTRRHRDTVWLIFFHFSFSLKRFLGLAHKTGDPRLHIWV